MLTQGLKGFGHSILLLVVCMTKFAETGVIIRERRSQSLSTLGSLTALIIGTKLANTISFRILKAELYAFISGLTSGEGDGLIIGLANGDLTVAEIKECIEAQGPLNPSDRVGNERAKRAVWLLGSTDAEIDTNGFFDSDMENAGQHKIVTKPRWTFTEGVGWNWFLWNTGPSPLTTGATIEITSTNFGVWTN